MLTRAALAAAERLLSTALKMQFLFKLVNKERGSSAGLSICINSKGRAWI